MGLSDLQRLLENFPTRNEFLHEKLEHRYKQVKIYDQPNLRWYFVVDRILRRSMWSQKFRERLISICLKEQAFTDITFGLKDGKYAAHRAMLSSRCDVMRAMFSGNFIEKNAKVVSIHTFTLWERKKKGSSVSNFQYRGSLLAHPLSFVCVSDKIPRCKFRHFPPTIDVFVRGRNWTGIVDAMSRPHRVSEPTLFDQVDESGRAGGHRRTERLGDCRKSWPHSKVPRTVTNVPGELLGPIPDVLVEKKFTRNDSIA